MKFGQKIFLISFAFMTIVMNLLGILIIHNNDKIQIQAKIEKSISNIKNISNYLKFYDVSKSIIKRDNTYYEIAKDNNIIYSNINFDIRDIKNKIIPTDENIKCIILNDTLFMSTKTGGYSIILMEDIKDLFSLRKEQINFFIKLSILFSFLIGFVFYFIVYLLTRKIKKLNKTVNQLAKGEYGIRSPKLGKDEVGELAISFNKMAESIESTIKEIRRISENRQNFINDITHEIRTPLTSIIGYSSLIKNRKIDKKETIIEYNNKIYEEGIYLNLLSQRLVDIVLLEHQEIEWEEISISKTIEEIIVRIEFQNRDVKFIKEIEPNIIFKSDKILLYSLVNNIVKNAILSYPNSKEKTVKIRLEKVEEKWIVLSIMDNGKGMTKEQVERVTEPFYTSNQNRNRKISGMGLGLPLCVKICEVLKANLKIESSFGKGTLVRIKFKKGEKS